MLEQFMKIMIVNTLTIIRQQLYQKVFLKKFSMTSFGLNGSPLYCSNTTSRISHFLCNTFSITIQSYYSSIYTEFDVKIAPK